MGTVRKVRRVLVVGPAHLAIEAAASVALRTRSAGPVGLVVLPPAGAEEGSELMATEGSVDKSKGRHLPLPTPGAVRVAAQLRRAGHPATARWRLVVCTPASSDQVDDAVAIVEAGCGCVTAVSANGGDEGTGILACDLAVGVVPEDAPDELTHEAHELMVNKARAGVVIQLGDPGIGRSLPLAGLCPPPEWAVSLDALDAQFEGSENG